MRDLQHRRCILLSSGVYCDYFSQTGMNMKKVLLCVFTLLLLTGCSGKALSEATTSPDISMEETTAAAAVQTEEESSALYVSLGDSIARGYGLSNIPEERFSTIAGQNWDIPADAVYNYGVDGQTSGELITMLQQNMPSSLAQADVISISIGANNVLKYAFQFLYDYYLYLYAEPSQYTDQEIAALFRDFIENADRGCETLAEDLPVLLETIRAVNPDCQILFLTLYNPYAAVNTELHINGMPILLSALSDSYAVKINNCIRESTKNAENLTLVDVYSAFTGRTSELLYAVTPPELDPSEMDMQYMDPHPNARGHRLIGQLVSESYTIE